ncbi:MAG: YdcF family protein [Acidobacteria bacterium]|nr:YdcF family protein [Acidobacteriota bacterium]
MPPSVESLEESAYAALLTPIWDFLALTHDPVPSDVIFVFGSRDLGVARRAAALYAAGLSSRVLVSGRLGPMTERVFDKPEALVFSNELTRLDVPASAITTEVHAGNTLENVRFGMSAVHAAGQTPRSALLVAKAFVMRRCVATFARQHPEVDVRACPPAGSLATHRDRPRAAFAARLVAELDRIDAYGATGDIEPQVIPENVREAARRVEVLLSAI